MALFTCSSAIYLHVWSSKDGEYRIMKQEYTFCVCDNGENIRVDVILIIAEIIYTDLWNHKVDCWWIPLAVYMFI